MNREVEYPLPKVEDPIEVFDSASDAAGWLAYNYPDAPNVDVSSIKEPSVRVLEYIAGHRWHSGITRATGIKGGGLQSCYKKLLGLGFVRILDQELWDWGQFGLEVTDRGWAFLESIGRLPEEVI